MDNTVIKREWLLEQEYFQDKICQKAINCSELRYIAGVDVAYTRIGNQEYGFQTAVRSFAPERALIPCKDRSRL